MKQSIAVTGASGFVGGRLVQSLAAGGWKVYAVTSRPRLMASAAGIVPVACDWTPDGMRSAIRAAQEVSFWVHAAARVDLTGGAPMPLYDGNAVLTEVLATTLAERDEVRLVYLSSVSVYGPLQRPAIDVEPKPETHYGISKLLGERFAASHLPERSLVLRLAGIWGMEYEPKLFVNHALVRALRGEPVVLKGAGSERRNYLWVGDLARVVEIACRDGWSGVRLAAADETLTIREMAATITDALGVPLDRLDPEHAPGADIIVESTLGLGTIPFRDALAVEINEGAGTLKLGVIADIHGNHAALKAVVDRLVGVVDRVVFLGDLFGYYSFVSECLTLLKTLDVVAVRGNHDLVALDWLRDKNSLPSTYRARYGSALERAAVRLSAAEIERVASWPVRQTLEQVGRRIEAIHGAPWDPLEGRVYPDFNEWAKFDECGADLILLGHTHYPLVRRLGARLVVNPGSVGQPRDASGAASYAVVDLTRWEVNLERAPYDCNELLEDSRAHDPDLDYLTRVLTR